MRHTVHRLVHAGSHHAEGGRSCSLFEVVHSPLAHRRTEALAVGNPAVAGRTVAIDHMADSQAEVWSNLGGTDCIDQTLFEESQYSQGPKDFWIVAN